MEHKEVYTVKFIVSEGHRKTSMMYALEGLEWSDYDDVKRLGQLFKDNVNCEFRIYKQLLLV